MHDIRSSPWSRFFFAILSATTMAFAHSSPAAASAPACSTPHYREFDYFIGRFIVSDKHGKTIGTDEVTSAVDGCALLEQWHGRTVQGVGYSAYDAARNRWVQTFFQNDGTVLYFTGNMTKDGMLIAGDDYSKAGTREQNRVLFRRLHDGFEEFWTVSTDGGRTWRTVFDGFFHRRIRHADR